MNISTPSIIIKGATNITPVILRSLCPETDDFGETIIYTVEDKWSAIRQIRDELLTQTDWVMLADSCNQIFKEEVIIYRQTLRDITINFPTPEEVIFPEIPSSPHKRLDPYVVPVYVLAELNVDRNIDGNDNGHIKMHRVTATIVKDLKNAGLVK